MNLVSTVLKVLYEEWEFLTGNPQAEETPAALESEKSSAVFFNTILKWNIPYGSERAGSRDIRFQGELSLVQDEQDNLVWHLFDKRLRVTSKALYKSDHSDYTEYEEILSREEYDLFQKDLRACYEKPRVSIEKESDHAHNARIARIEQNEAAVLKKYIPLRARLDFLENFEGRGSCAWIDAKDFELVADRADQAAKRPIGSWKREFSLDYRETREETYPFRGEILQVNLSSFVFLNPVTLSSRLDEKIKIKWNEWAISLVIAGSSRCNPLTWAGHAAIVIEGVEKGRHFIHFAHFIKRDGGSVLLEDLSDRFNPDKIKKIKGTWSRRKWELKRMLDGIVYESEHKYHKFALVGGDSVFAQSDDLSIHYHNCLTWSLEKLGEANIQLPKNPQSWLAAMP